MKMSVKRSRRDNEDEKRVCARTTTLAVRHTQRYEKDIEENKNEILLAGALHTGRS